MMTGLDYLLRNCTLQLTKFILIMLCFLLQKDLYAFFVLKESLLSIESLNAKQVGECHIRLPFFIWDTFLYEVGAESDIPSNYCYEFSDMRFISLKDLKKYKLAFGVKKEVKTFRQVLNPTGRQNVHYK